MKSKLFFLLLLMNFGTLSVNSVAQKSIIVQLRDGSESALQLELLQKMTFATGILELRNPSEILLSFNIEEIQKIRFGVYSSVVSPATERVLQLFPNPVSDYFTLKNASKETCKATIFSIDGRIMKEIILKGENQQINVTELKTGIYLLRTNKSTLKFSKL